LLPQHYSRIDVPTQVDAQKKSLKADEQQRADVKAERVRWRRRVGQVSKDRLLFLDESGAKTNMKRLYGWSAKGTRLVDSVPGGHWTTTTMISAIRLSGVATAMVTEGPTDATVFTGFTEHFLAPVLKKGDIVVMDNLSSHKVKKVVELIEAVGAQAWYLPPYSPDFNPIEQMWSKVKAILRSFAKRTKKTLYSAIGKALQMVDPMECVNYFANCGYHAT
jgi:transposase